MSGGMAWVVAVGAKVVTEGEWVATSWLVLVMIPGEGKPVY